MKIIENMFTFFKSFIV